MGILVLLLAAAATVLTVGWLYLLLRSAQEDWVAAAYNQILHNLDTMEKLRRKAQKNRETLEQYHGISRAVVMLLQDGSIEKQRHKLEQTNQKLQAENLRSVNPVAIPGYVLHRERQRDRSQRVPTYPRHKNADHDVIKRLDKHRDYHRHCH